MTSIKRPRNVLAVCPECGTEKRFLVLVRRGQEPPETLERNCPVCNTERPFERVAE